MPDVIVRSVKRVWQQLAGDEGEGGETFSVGYVVELSDASNMGPRLARAAVGINYGDRFVESFPDEVPSGDESGMTCQSVNASVRTTAPWIVDVAVKFGLRRSANGNVVAIADPLARPPAIEWVVDGREVPAVHDLDKRLVANSAGEPLPGIEVSTSQIKMKVRKNMESVTPAWLFGICQRVNSDAFYGAEPGQARIQGATATQATENAVGYWDVSIEIVFRKEKWNDNQIRDRGVRHLVDYRDDASYPNVVDHVPIMDMFSQPITEPVDLDGHGQELKGDGPDGSPKKPVYIDPPFRFYDEMAFSTLGIGGGGEIASDDDDGDEEDDGDDTSAGSDGEDDAAGDA